MQKSKLQVLQGYQRLLILEVLRDSPAYCASDDNIDRMLDLNGQRVAFDVVLGHIDWLEEQGFVESERVTAKRVVTITQRGLDVAEGQAVVSGVARPRP
ncbi:ArsR family transcriptional regulator [Vibrio navarrensis]|nr:ArsR family transcriptional regulator [Vibrio navarrensis]